MRWLVGAVGIEDKSFGATLDALSYCRLLPPRQIVKLLVGSEMTGAGDGNRTHVRSLGSFYSAIELRPLAIMAIIAHKRRCGATKARAESALLTAPTKVPLR